MTEVRRLARRLLKARMDHPCDLCGGTISRGQKYVRSTMLVDGKFGTQRYHVAAGEADQDECDEPMRPRKPFWATDGAEEE